MSAPDQFDDAARMRIRKAVSEAELLTSGEIRVYIEDESRGDVLDRAVFVFEQLGMHKTALRNGVLIYLAVQDHRFAIIGDAGIHEKVGHDFWDTVKEEMGNHFRSGRFAEGIVLGVTRAGEKLQHFFPRKKGDVNELPDDMIFGKGGSE